MRRYRQSLWANGPLSAAAAVLCGLLCIAAAAVLSAALIDTVIKDIHTAGAFAGAALAFGGYTGAYIYGRYRRRKGLLGGTLCGTLIYCVLSVAALIVFGAPAGIKKLLLLTFSGAAGGVAGVNSKRPRSLRDQ